MSWSLFLKEFKLPLKDFKENLRFPVDVEYTVPKRMIEAGKKVRISVSLLPPVADCITWFMVFDRKDTLKLTEGSLSEEIMVMQRDNIRFKVMVDALARKYIQSFFRKK